MISFTLVSTTLNEMRRLEDSILDIERQLLVPNEIIIVDAGSTDGTFERLIEWKNSSKLSIKIVSDAGCNVAEGRNKAIELAKTDLIASTDFGCRYHPEWLQSIIKPFVEDPKIEVVGGSFKVLDEDIQNLAQKSDYVLQNGYKQIMDDHFSVSSRSIAYKKYVWEQIGGYPEWLTLAADDTIFWRQVRKRKFPYILIDKQYVYWMRHRTFPAFGKEARRYGLGDGESGINLRTYISHIVETSLRYSFLIHLLLLPAYIHLTALPAFLFIPQFFGLRSYFHGFRKWLKWKSSKFNLSVLIGCFRMIEVSRFNYIKGYTQGLLSRDKIQKQASKKLLAEIS